MKNILIILIILTPIINVSSFKYTDISLTKIWEIDSVFLTPESVVYDSKRGCIYISNFNDLGGFRKKEDTIFNECISKVDLKGNIIKFRWIDSLIGPTGITIFNDKLYIIERGFLTLVNIDKEIIEHRYPINKSGFPNDIAVDIKGNIYISDSRNKVIMRFANNSFETWLQDTILEGPNGLYVENNNLIIGNRGTNNLISVSIPDKKIKIIATNISNGIDGIKRMNNDYIISWRSKIFLADNSGSCKVLLDTQNRNEMCADFEYIESENLIIVPTLLSNKLIAYKINR